MRKRNKQGGTWIDNEERCQDHKRRRKTKSSEKFARELQSFEHTLDNVKQLYADSKNRLRLAGNSVIKTLCYTEILDKASAPPSISPGILSPQQKALPIFGEVSTPPISTSISSAELHTSPNFDQVSTPPISTGILSPQHGTPPILTRISAPRQHILPSFDEVSVPATSIGILLPQQHTFFDEVSTAISSGIPSPPQHTSPNFDEVSSPPIITGISPPEQHTLPFSMEQAPAGEDPSASNHQFTTDNKSEPSKSIKDIEGVEEVIVSACVKENKEAPSLLIEPPSGSCGNPEARNGRDSLSQSMQQEHSSKLPRHEAAVVLVSNVFSSFLKRLIKHGVHIDLRSSPGYKKNVLVVHQVEESKHFGMEELKDAEPEKQLDTISLPSSKIQEDSKNLQAVELEKQIKSSSLSLNQIQEVAEETKEIESEMHLSTSILLISRSEEVAKESKEGDQEENVSSLFTIHENDADELKETGLEKKVEMSFSLFSTMDDIESESDNEDDGDLKHLWDDMEFSLACMNESKRDQGKKKNDGCNHDFYKKDDLGLVCSLCGLVGQDTEHIFNYIWGEASKKRHNGKHAVARANPSTSPVEEEFSHGLESLPVQQINQALVLHSEYKDKIRTHQEEGIRFLQRNLVQDEPNGCILAHAPGTGKSFLIIAFLQSFQNTFPDERPVIVAPNGMLCVWVREFEKWKVEDIPIFNLYEAPSSQEQDDYENSGVLHKRRQGQLKMLQEWRARKSILLVGYPTFSRLISGNDAVVFPGIKKLLLEVPGLLILDEGHFPRNKDTQILKSLSQVQTRRRVLLSGTLFQNNFYELYNLYYLVRPDFMTLNASCTKSLLEEYMKSNCSPAKMKLSQQSPKGSKLRSRREDMELRLFENLGETIKLGEPEKKRQAINQLRQLSEPFVHWYKGQVLEELPGLVDLTLILRMTPLQQELLSSLQVKIENQLDRTIKSTKICIHPSLVNMATDAAHNNEPPWKDSEVDPKSSSKIMFVLDLLQLAAPHQEKVLLFSQLLDPFYLLEKMLKKLWQWRLNREILKIEGQTSLEERENVIDRYNKDPKSRILFASIKTCGEGVSLIGASRIVLLDVQWNPMVSRQAISRAFRIGQKRKVYVYRLVGQDSMEEYAHMKASEKEWLAKQIFEGCRDDDYTSYCHEVNPVEVDMYFESGYLRENIHKCLRYHFV